MGHESETVGLPAVRQACAGTASYPSWVDPDPSNPSPHTHTNNKIPSKRSIRYVIFFMCCHPAFLAHEDSLSQQLQRVIDATK